MSGNGDMDSSSLSLQFVGSLLRYSQRRRGSAYPVIAFSG